MVLRLRSPVLEEMSVEAPLETRGRSVKLALSEKWQTEDQGDTTPFLLGCSCNNSMDSLYGSAMPVLRCGNYSSFTYGDTPASTPFDSS